MQIFNYYFCFLFQANLLQMVSVKLALHVPILLLVQIQLRVEVCFHPGILRIIPLEQVVSLYLKDYLEKKLGLNLRTFNFTMLIKGKNLIHQILLYERWINYKFGFINCLLYLKRRKNSNFTFIYVWYWKKNIF